MIIRTVSLVRNNISNKNVVAIEGENSIYSLTEEQIKDALVRAGDMCEFCEDSGLVGRDDGSDSSRQTVCVCRKKAWDE